MWSGNDKSEFAAFIHKELSEAAARIADDRSREIKHMTACCGIAAIALGLVGAVIAAAVNAPTAAGVAVIPLGGGLALMLVRLMM